MAQQSMEQLEEQLGRIRALLGRRGRRGGGWLGLLGGLGLGALIGGAVAFALRSREEEEYAPPPAPLASAPPARREEESVVLQGRPAPASARAAEPDDAPIRLKPPVAAPAPAAGADTPEATSGWVAPATGEAAPTPGAAPLPAAAAPQGAAAAPAATEEETPAAELIEAPVADLYPGSVAPTDGQCPPSHPIKGNINRNSELIFHTPGGNNYDQTHPEACFASEEDAEAAGFRKARG